VSKTTPPGAAQAPRTLQEFMVQAYAMEREAVERYGEFADAMETHNNREVAALFRAMAGYEARHAEQIMAEMGWTTPPARPAGGLHWGDFEAPETVPIESVHYLMRPWHALQLALAAEQRAEAFFKALADAATDEAVQRAARELQAEEAEHVELVKAWMAKVPTPDSNWQDDPDPPRYNE
jgi:rubrerythrin